MKLRPIRKYRKTLMTRFILIIATALIFIPVLIPLSFLASWGVNTLLYPHKEAVQPRQYPPGNDIEAEWHVAASSLRDAHVEMINDRLRQLQQKYPDASLFWVDSTGTTRLQLPEQASRPVKWSLEDIIAFMKSRVDSDPFTIVAFIGGDEHAKQGFMVFELSRKHLRQSADNQASRNSRFYGLFLSFMFLFFILMTILFFREIRRRLLRLEAGMTETGENGVPVPVPEGRPDEIGRLEQAFNQMIYALEESRKREREEEDLRKNLISNLSHDLRTPLTVLASHLYSIRQEPLSEQGRQSLSLMEMKIRDLDGLMDHLLSYNLLSSGRYTLSSERLDMVRIVRESAAAWYPVWEKAGLEADIDLPDEPVFWNMDEQGFRRVLDNLFQNLVRHAGSGGYVGIRVLGAGEAGGSAAKSGEPATPALVISDRGPGMHAGSGNQGAGLGLQIVDLLLGEMGLERVTRTSIGGTVFYIYPSEENDKLRLNSKM